MAKRRIKKLGSIKQAKTTGGSVASKEVAVKGSNGLTTQSDLQSFGFDNVSQDDIMIPKLLVMQGMSEFVTSGKAKFGDLVDSVSEQVLGSDKQPVEFLPLKVEKLWRVEHKVGSKYALKRIEAVTPLNEKRSYEGVDLEDGKDVRFVRTLNFYVLLTSQVKDGSEFPYYLTFKSTSLNGGKKIMTQIMRNISMKKTPFHAVFSLVPKKQQNDDGTFMTMDVEVKRESSIEELQAAKKWADTLNKSAHKVDDEEVPF